MNIYVIYDNLGISPSGLPFFQPNHDCARRQLRAQFKDAPFDLSSFECRFVGTYNPDSSVILGTSEVDSSSIFFLSELFDSPKKSSKSKR